MWQLRLGAAFAALLFKAVPCSERAKGWNVLGRGSVSALWKDWWSDWLIDELAASWSKWVIGLWLCWGMIGQVTSGWVSGQIHPWAEDWWVLYLGVLLDWVNRSISDHYHLCHFNMFTACCKGQWNLSECRNLSDRDMKLMFWGAAIGLRRTWDTTNKANLAGTWNAQDVS